MADRDERWYSGRWQRRSEHNERVWQESAVKIEQLAAEGRWSAERLEEMQLKNRQHLLGWRDQ